MLEAELFGFEAGVFTDAKRAKPGLFEAAAGGTLFLDEIDALPMTLQGKLLTAIEAKRVRRVGAVREQGVDVELVTATQAALSARVAAGGSFAPICNCPITIGSSTLRVSRALMTPTCAGSRRPS